MDAATPDTNLRSFFLDLPAELRVMIYEECARPRLQLGRLVHHQLVPGLWHPFVKEEAKYFALASVNRQIREESTPILYRNVQLFLYATEEAARLWIAGVDPAALSDIQSFVIIFGCPCRSRARIEMANLERPWHVTRGFLGCKLCVSCTANILASVAEEKVLKLEIVGGERRIMTKEVLMEIVLLWSRQEDDHAG
jgi:hypothetical protein